jgi:lauroyl/myristoyl acyltransferase
MRWRADDFSLRYHALFPAYSQLPPALAYRLAAWHTPLFQRRKSQEATWVKQQLQLTFPQAADAQLQHWLDAYFQMQEYEALDTWYLQHQPIQQLIQLQGFEAVKQARAQGQRVLITSGHFGRYWLTGAAMRAQGLSTGTITRDGGQENTHQLHPAEFKYRLAKLQRLQQVLGGPFLVEGTDIRPLYRALDEHLIAIIFDVPYVKFHPGCVTVPFLQSTINLPAGIYRIAKRTKAVVAPFFMRDLGNGQVRAEFLSLLDPRDYNEISFMGILANMLEQRVRDNPEHWWLWAALPMLRGHNNESNRCFE